MATIAENINTLKTIKEDIKQAINNKGVTVADSDSFTLYANKISEIQAGGGNEEEIAKTARVLDVTENGYYLSKYSDPVIIYPELVTGDFSDGTYFYDYGEIINGCYNTKIIPDVNTRVEFWWKPTTPRGNNSAIFGAGSDFILKYQSSSTNQLYLRVGNNNVSFNFDNTIWHHFVIENGIVYDNDEQVATLVIEGTLFNNVPILLNSDCDYLERNANGLFGMFKIDGHIFIPSDGGFINYNTGEELGGYTTNSNANYIYNETDTTNITGYFDDGTEFKNYALLDAAYFDTNIQATPNSRIEFWYRNNKFDKDYNTIIGAQDGNSFVFKVCEKTKTKMGIEYGSPSNYNHNQEFNFSYDNNWHHFIMSKADGLVLDGVKQFDLKGTFKSGVSYPDFYINCSYLGESSYNANGEIGMIKIDDNIFIPTEKGFINYKTNELLSSNWSYSDEEIPFIGEYYFTENEIIEYEPEGNLIKTAYVNVPPKLSDRKINFAYSTFDKIPDGLIGWQKITDMNSMFRECSQLKDLGDIDTSNVISFKYAFYGCTQLADFSKINLSNAASLYYAFANTKIDNDVINNFDTSNVTDISYAFYGTPITYFPSINTSNVTTFKGIFENSMNLEEVHPIDTSKATDLSYMFYHFSSEHKLRKLPEFDCTNVTNMSNIFSYYQDKMDYFTDCGGWKNLKCNWSDNYGLRACANLSYESCINILNGLWDFRGNGDTTTTKTLKVHQNFLNTVGDEVSIATAKGWNITA